MENGKIQKLKELLSNDNFGIFCEPNPTEESFLANKALWFALSLAKKNVLKDICKKEEYETKWKDILSKNYAKEIISTPQKIQIKIPKTSDISEVNYDESKKFLNFYITPKNGAIDIDKIVISPALPEIGVAFCFFEKESLLNKISDHYILPKKDNVVMVAPNDKLIIEKTADVIRLIGEDVYKNECVATLLFAGLIIETGNFSHHISKSALGLASTLLGNGANKEVVSNIQTAQKTPDISKILGRALARTHIDRHLNTVWSFLPEKDFIKTNTQPSNSLFLYIIKSFMQILPEELRYLILWEENSYVTGFVYSKKEEHIAPLAAKLGISLESTYFTTDKYPSFSKGESHLRELLKNIV